MQDRSLKNKELKQVLKVRETQEKMEELFFFMISERIIAARPKLG